MDNYPEISNIRKSIKSHYPVSDESIGLLCLYHNRAGFEYVETIEPTLAYSIPISILNELYETNIEIANWGRVIHQECLLSLQCIRIDNLTMTAKDMKHCSAHFRISAKESIWATSLPSSAYRYLR